MRSGSFNVLENGGYQEVPSMMCERSGATVTTTITNPLVGVYGTFKGDFSGNGASFDMVENGVMPVYRLIYLYHLPPQQRELRAFVPFLAAPLLQLQ